MADDSISIKIAASSDTAVKAVDKLVDSLSKLNMALLNYDKKNSYTSGLTNIATAFDTISKAVDRIDSGKIKTLASSISSLTKSVDKINTVADKINFSHASDSARIFNTEVEKTASSIASSFGITDKKVVEELTSLFGQLAQTLNNVRTDEQAKGMKNFDTIYSHIVSTIKENQGSVEEAATGFRDLVESVRAMNQASSGGVSFDKVFKGASEFGDDYKNMRATLGKGWAQDNGGMSFDSWVQSLPTSELAALNNMIELMGGNIDDNTSQFAALVEIVKSYGDATSSTTTDLATQKQSMEAIHESVTAAAYDFQALSDALGKTNISTANNTDNITKMADGLERFSSLNIPEMPGLTSLVDNIHRLGLGSAEKAAATIPQIASGLNRLVGDMNQLSGLTFDSASLNGLLDSINRLGLGNATKAAANIPFIADGLKQLVSSMNELKAVSFDTSGLTELVKSIGVLGGKGVTNAITNMPQLTSGISNLIHELSKLPSVNSNVIETINSIANLASQGSKVGTAFDSMGNSINRTSGLLPKLTTGLNRTTKSTFSLAAAFGKMYASYWLIFRGINKLKSAIDISSSLTEVQNVVDHTFGNMSNIINEFSETSIKDFGMSILTTKQIASKFQAMGVAMGITDKQVKDSNATWQALSDTYDNTADSMADMSLNLTKLTADLASFYNYENYDEVGQKLEAIFTGQTRPLRTFGIDLTQATLKEWALTQGIQANFQTMTQAEKTMLRYQYVMAHTSNIQGDFIRTSNSWANIARVLNQNLQNLGATIGGTLVNAFKPLLAALNSAILKFNEFAKAVSNSLGVIFGWTFESGSSGVTEDVADDTEDMADNLGTAAGNAKKLKQNLMGIDELNINSGDQDSSGGSGSSSSSAAAGDSGKWTKGESLFDKYSSEFDTFEKLGKFIQGKIIDGLDAIDWDKVFSKFSNFGTELANFLNGLISPTLFAKLGSSVADAINSALYFLNSFGTTFDWDNFGKSLGSGLNAFMLKFDWNTALSNARIFGQGIANTINNAFDETDFDLIGQTVANFINTKIEFWLAMGQTLDFTMFGEKLSQALTSFIKTLEWKDLALAIKTWVCGALDMASTFLNKTDFDMIGQKIGEFLADLDFEKILGKIAKAIWKALQAAFKLVTGMMKEAPLETALIAGFAIMKFTKLGNAVSTMISTSIASKLASSLGVAVGKNSSISKVLTDGLIKDLALIGTTTKDSFELATTAVAGGEKVFSSFSTSIGAGIEQISSNLSILSKGILGIGSVWAEFSVVSDTVTDLMTGTDNLLEGIGKIGGVSAAAGAALAVAFGPAGIAVGAIAGLVGAIKGINDAWKEIDTKEAEDGIYNAMTNPNGTPIETLTDNAKTKIASVGEGFKEIADKSVELNNTKTNVDNTVTSIGQIKQAITDGAYTVSEKIPEIQAAFDQLKTDSYTLFNEEYDIVYTGVAGALKDSLSEMGIYVPEIMAVLNQFKGEYTSKVDEIETKSAELTQRWEEGRISDSEYFYTMTKYSEDLAKLSGEYDTTTLAVNDFNTAIQGIDFTAITNADGSVNTTALRDQIDMIATSANETRAAIDGSSDSMTSAIQDLITKAEAVGNTEAVTNLGYVLTANGESVLAAKEDVTTAVQEYADTIQTEMLQNLPTIMDQAIAEYEGKGPLYKLFHSEDSYVENYLQKYKTDTIDPMMSELESLYEQTGVEGSVWGKEASEAIIKSVFDGEYVRQQNTSDYETALKTTMAQAVEAGTKDVEEKAKDSGKNTVSGYNKGIEENAKTSTDKVNTWIDLVTAGIEARLDINSPSKVTEEYGMYTVEGFNKGIEDYKDTTSTLIEEWMLSISESFSSDTFKELTVGLTTGITDNWAEFRTLWDEALILWNEESIIPYFGYDTWYETASNIPLAFATMWEELNVQWKADIELWWKTYVEPYFKQETWEKNGKNMRDGIKQGFQGLASDVGVILNQVISAFNSAFSNIADSINDLIEQYNKLASQVGGGSSLSKITIKQASSVSIPKFAEGGMPNEASLFWAGENGIAEMIGTVGGRTAVAGGQEITGITDAVYSTGNTNASLMQTAISLLNTIAQKDSTIEIDGRELADYVTARTERNGYSFT